MKNTIEVLLKALNMKDQEAMIDIQETSLKENHTLQDKHMILNNMVTTEELIFMMMIVRRSRQITEDTGIKTKIQTQKIQEHHTNKLSIFLRLKSKN